MKTSFSTLGCADWSLRHVLDEAKRLGFDGVELRFIDGTDALWELPELSSGGLAATKREVLDRGLVISSVGARAHFHFIDPAKRKAQMEEAKRNVDIAAALGCTGVRVWGDKVQPGGDRESTMKWISEALWTLADYGRPAGVNMRLETHGDFTRSTDVIALLRGCGCHGAAATWDPANVLAGCGEDPAVGAANLGAYIEHVHFKDEKLLGNGKRDITLLGHGDIPLLKIVSSLKKLRYQGFVSLEWEKKYFPNAPGPEVAFPDFIDWWKKNGA
ncbi:MAG TPA: sugar phosphate isomerase/epimerase family protein [Bryobacteraceae bacterium]|nr:sugar phosphate isomerase/epimerase family protein [Bryobacteraceae bacterium]